MSVSTVMPSIQLESRLMVEIIRMKAASPSRVSKVPSFMALTRKWCASPPYSYQSVTLPFPKMERITQFTAQGVPRWA